LIKDFAKEFSTRVEMKQVGFRQEAARLGIGSCGRIMLLYLVDGL
jgi:cell fate regulator YaaT (PSP1 superfamily)